MHQPLPSPDARCCLWPHIRRIPARLFQCGVAFWRRSSAVVLSAGVLTTVLSGWASADFMFFHGGHSYLTVTTPDTWASAAADATTRQFAGEFGQLARIDDQVENDAIQAALLANIPAGDFGRTVAPDGGGGSFVWIGATDRQSEGQWYGLPLAAYRFLPLRPG